MTSKVDPSKLNYRFSATAISPDFVKAKLFLELLLQHPNFSDFLTSDDVLVMINLLVSFITCSKPPTQMKESCFLLLSQLLSILRNSTQLMKIIYAISYDLFTPLQDELEALTELEMKKSATLYSSYFQSLSDLIISVNLSKTIAQRSKSR